MSVKSKKSLSLLAAMQRMELYFMAYPGSPSAIRRPRLSMHGKVWTAVLGPNLKEGITGFGPTVEAALRSFDAQYLQALRPSAVSSNNQMQRAPRSGYQTSDFDWCIGEISASNPLRADFLRIVR